jgi:hypothetical protein
MISRIDYDTVFGTAHVPLPEPDQGTPAPPPEVPPEIPPEIIDPPLPHQIEPIRDPPIVPGQKA